jgi:hypothetical protein
MTSQSQLGGLDIISQFPAELRVRFAALVGSTKQSLHAAELFRAAEQTDLYSTREQTCE